MNFTIAATSLLAFATPAQATAEDSTDPLFASDAILHAEIEAPFEMLADERPNEDELPGKFRYTADNGELIELDIVIRTRGRLRRQKETCTFPPLRLNFKKKQVDDTLFDKQDKLKLVSHCRNNSHTYEQAVVAEYVVYRILNLLTDRSFHARLLRVNYKFTDERRNIESYAILIEHKERLEKRLNANTTKTEKVKVADLQPEDLNLTSVFHFFIGNTDFSPIASAPDEDCCHNQVLLQRKGDLALTVPYDFDQAGLVGAPHAAPNPRFNISSTRQRVYRGRCVNNQHLPATLDLFRERRGAIEALIREQQGLDKKKSKLMLDFVEKFYETIDKPKRLERAIVEKCI